MSVEVAFEINGSRYDLEIDPGAFLSDVLRTQLGHLEIKEACQEGECGSCTVIVDGFAVDSCIYLAAQASNRQITTIVGLHEDDIVRRLQEAFTATGAVQCGFCTPGFLTAAAALIKELPHPTEEEVRSGLAGNLCRCTGYNSIVEAVLRSARIR